jgi:hypothetical protein
MFWTLLGIALRFVFAGAGSSSAISATKLVTVTSHKLIHDSFVE